MLSSVITVMNMKGGVGKTFLSCHLAGMLARYGFPDQQGKDLKRKVLAIDFDPQFNMSQTFLPVATYLKAEGDGRTSLAILKDDERIVNPYSIQVPANIHPPKVAELRVGVAAASLDLIPGTLDLMYCALGQPEQRVGTFMTRMKHFLEEARKEYHVVVIDCHPAASVLSRCALLNSDHVLIPVAPSPYASRGVALMKRFLDENTLASRQPTSHVVFNLVETAPSPSETDIRGHAEFGPWCLQHSLKWRKAYEEASQGKGFVWYSQKSWSTTAFIELQKVVAEFASKAKV